MDTDEKHGADGRPGPGIPKEFGGASAKPAAEDGAAPRAARSLFEPAALSSRLLPEDLPYASEVEAALARRPSKGARWLSLAVFLFFVLFIVWAGFATLDEVTHAEGQVVPSSRTQIIQNLEGGILSSVEVHEGQIVEKTTCLPASTMKWRKAICATCCTRPWKTSLPSAACGLPFPAKSLRGRKIYVHGWSGE